jgi:hypothetical protein
MELGRQEPLNIEQCRGPTPCLEHILHHILCLSSGEIDCVLTQGRAMICRLGGRHVNGLDATFAYRICIGRSSNMRKMACTPLLTHKLADRYCSLGLDSLSRIGVAYDLHYAIPEVRDGLTVAPTRWTE